MIYFDTSYLVRLYFEDAGFEAVRELAASDHVACATLGQVETIAAFHRKFREGAIPLKSYNTLLAQFTADEESDAFHWLPANSDVAQRVRKIYTALPATVYLRGADALHLATAATNSFKTIYSNDAHLLAAASHFGLKGTNLISPH